MHYYQHHIGDFNSATRHLTRVERALYRDLIDLYYDKESPLISDLCKLSRLVMAHSDDEKDALKVVLDEFFTLKDGLYYNKRCDDEILKYQSNLKAKARAGKASAAARSKKKKSKELTGDEHVLNSVPTNSQQNLTNQEPLTKNQEPLTKNQKNITSLASDCPHNEILQAWAKSLPELAQPRVWSDDRKKVLRTRWREDEKRQNIEWWTGLFNYIATSDFLMGRNSDWQVDLPWLLKASNFNKVLDGNYDNRQGQAQPDYMSKTKNVLDKLEL